MQQTSSPRTPTARRATLTRMQLERKAHADKCAASGRAWALTINEHTSNKSLWQYVHDAFAHVHEDIMEHGAGVRNDDAILEKGNRSSNVG